MDARTHLVPVSYVLFRRGEHVLLQLRAGTGFMDGYWSTAAAGHVEAGESVVDAAVREAREELGVLLTSEDLNPVTTLHRLQEGGPAAGNRIDFFFECSAWQGEPRVMEPHRTSRLGWFHLDDLPLAVVPHERYVLDRVRAGLPPIVAFGSTAVIRPRPQRR